MKRYIKSFTADQLKQQLGDNYPEGGYLYIFKHGIGPGTIPKDVQVVKTKDLPNYYTAVWLDRFLTTPELKQYDIPDETRINELLGRINYCQKNGDVVPCDDVEACSNKPVNASITIRYDVQDRKDRSWTKIDVDSKRGPKGAAEEFLGGPVVKTNSSDADCLVQLAGSQTDKFKAMTGRYGKSLYYKKADVEACDKVTASRTINRWNRDIEEYEPVEIPDDWNVTTYSSDMDEEVNCVHCGKPLPFGESYCSRRYHDRYGLGYAECEDCYEEQLNDEFGNKDVNACGAVEAASTKYFANMVSASEHPNTYGYMVSGYYDSDRRGLAENEWTEDIATVDELANEYANKGYYIVVNNFETGAVLEFSADNWFDEIYPDGLSGVEGLI